MNKQPQIAQRRAEMPKPAERSQAFAGRERAQQQMATQRRSEAARPNAFEAPRNASTTRNYSQRGASSVQRSASAGHVRASGGGGGGARGGGGSRGGGGGGAEVDVDDWKNPTITVIASGQRWHAWEALRCRPCVTL